MSPAALRKSPARRRKKKRTPPSWMRWWPLALGLLATPFAVRAASVLALTGPSALRLLYPWVVLIQTHAQHFSPEQADTLSQWMMYGQFPIYGLLWVLAAHLIGRAAGPLSVLLLHGAGVAAATLSATQ